MHSFHSDPVVVNQFPSGFTTVGTAEFLPILDLLDALFFEGTELADFPVRAVFDGLKVGFHLGLESSGGRLLAQGCRLVPQEELEQDVPTTD